MSEIRWNGEDAVAPQLLEQKFLSWLKIKMDGMDVKDNLSASQTASLEGVLGKLYDGGSLDEKAFVDEMNRLFFQRHKYRTNSQKESERSKDIQAFYEDSHQYTNLLQYAANGRALFVTGEGFVGLGITIVQPGDQIWLLTDAHPPFVLRSTPSPNTFTLVGDCYMLDFMHGEMLYQN